MTDTETSGSTAQTRGLTLLGTAQTRLGQLLGRRTAASGPPACSARAPASRCLSSTGRRRRTVEPLSRALVGALRRDRPRPSRVRSEPRARRCRLDPDLGRALRVAARRLGPRTGQRGRRLAGGWLAAEIASTVPERIDRLVLMAPPGILIPDVPPADLFTMQPDQIVRALFLDSAKAEAMLGDPAATRGRGASRADAGVVRQYASEPFLHNPDLPDRLSSITAPDSRHHPRGRRDHPSPAQRGVCRGDRRCRAESAPALRSCPVLRATRSRRRRGDRLSCRHAGGDTVRVAVTTAPRRVLLEERPDPGPPEPGQTVVRVETGRHRGSDLHLYRDELGDSHVGSLPRVMGHEFSAIVSKPIPPGHRFQPGGRDRHAADARPAAVAARAVRDGRTCASICGSSGSMTTAPSKSTSPCRRATSSRHPT